MKNVALIILVIILCLVSCTQNKERNQTIKNIQSPLILVYDSISNQFGYQDKSGNYKIPKGKYLMCFTDTLKNYAVVISKKEGLIAIDREDNKLYNILSVDNGPDESSEGLFRIIANGKIGYADVISGKIVIPAKFKCAFPFENGRARVSNSCTSIQDGEHTSWESETWDYINKSGSIIKN